MYPDYQALITKEQEIKEIGLKAIPNNVSDREATCQLVTTHFIALTAPETALRPYEVVIIQNDGKRGGISRKPGNLVLSWSKLLYFVASLVVDGVAALEAQWLMPFVALHIWSTIQGASIRELSPRHAMTMVAMWEHKDGKQRISQEKGFEVTNAYLKKSEFPEITQLDFTAIIDDLKSIDCIVLDRGMIFLIERLEKHY
jgi:hypothetical protein